MPKVIATALLLLAIPPAVEAQQPSDTTVRPAVIAPAAIAPAVTDVTVATAPAVAPVPFGPGEKMTFRVTYGILGRRGSASSEVTRIEDIRGRPAYLLSFHVRGGALGWSMNDLQESWLDVGSLYSHRFMQNLNQSTYKRLRTLDFYPDEGMWRRVEQPDSGELATDMPLDDVSFLYWSRTLPLEVGETYEFNRYWRASSNPVIVRVLRRETVKVPAGTFNTIVVRPIIRTSGMFGDGGQAEVYFSDDERRLIVLVKTKMAIGTMQLQLEEYTPGENVTSLHH